MDNVFGVDVAKNWVGVVGPNGHARVGNDDLAAFAKRVSKQGGRVLRLLQREIESIDTRHRKVHRCI